MLILEPVTWDWEMGTGDGKEEAVDRTECDRDVGCQVFVYEAIDVLNDDEAEDEDADEADE